VVVGDFNTPLSPIDRHPDKNQQRNSRIERYHRSKASTDAYRVFHPVIAAHGTFSKIDRIIGHKASLKKYYKIGIAPCILSDHNAVKLELNNKSNSRK
jgi:endonuclease/exonuclease/phosphatase family metal-dependent hydrolase